ncbi:YcgN family cysteine cluster protein [Ahrensia kielensis]|uniref:YcgN family cysteine cluster protein n=1 Tax=Ahrensia kielensis TaxID=76980 RepID=UPI000361D5A1|nr:YcgN family cysteine cluster protein [Ahrensia kielensis]
MTVEKPYWEEKTLAEMTAGEWEALCDGCGKCCMSKLIDDDTDEIYYTTVACRLFDADSCRCSDYENRQQKVSDCVKLTPQNVGEIAWLPTTCAYRLLNEGKPLFDWHPLISGDASSVHKADISMQRAVTAFEQDMTHDGEYLEHLVDGSL